MTALVLALAWGGFIVLPMLGQTPRNGGATHSTAVRRSTTRLGDSQYLRAGLWTL